MNAVCEKGSRAAVAPSEASVDRDAALAAECRARADMYGLVARAYRTEADEELLDRLIDLAFKRQRQRDSLTYSYETNIFDTKATGMLKGTKGIKGL